MAWTEIVAGEVVVRCRPDKAAGTISTAIYRTTAWTKQAQYHTGVLASGDWHQPLVEGALPARHHDIIARSNGGGNHIQVVARPEQDGGGIHFELICNGVNRITVLPLVIYAIGGRDAQRLSL